MCFLSRQNIYWNNSSTRLALARTEKEEKKNHNKKKPMQENLLASSAASPPDLLLRAVPGRDPSAAPLDLGLQLAQGGCSLCLALEPMAGCKQSPRKNKVMGAAGHSCAERRLLQQQGC